MDSVGFRKSMADVSYTLQDTSKNTNDDKDIENTSDNEYLKKIQSKLEDIEFPIDFDAWTMQEQSVWLYHNITELYQNAPETLENMIPALFRSIDFDRSQQKLPEWIDINKYRRGQKFVRDNYFSVNFSILLGTIYAFTFTDVTKTVIIAGHSNTPYLAFKRFISTLTRILSWYDGEPWIKGTKAYKNMQFARAKHLAIAKKMARMSNEQIIAASKIANPLYSECDPFLKDFATTCPLLKLEKRPYKKAANLSIKAMKPMTTINNAIISVAQGSLILSNVIYSPNVGTHGATDEDLEAYCHMWKCYGYFLGVEDEYNFCRGSLKEIKQRMWDLSRYWVKANFTDVTPEGMHIIKCIAESLNYYPFIYMPYKTMALLCTEALNLEMPNLYASLNYGEWIAYNIYKFLLRHAMKLQIVRKYVNRISHEIIETASNFGPETLAKLQERSEQHLQDFSNK